MAGHRSRRGSRLAGWACVDIRTTLVVRLRTSTYVPSLVVYLWFSLIFISLTVFTCIVTLIAHFRHAPLLFQFIVTLSTRFLTLF